MAAFAHDLRTRLRTRHPLLQTDRYFALMLVDGLCTREESVVRAFHDGLGRTPLSGGSAGDGRRRKPATSNRVSTPRLKNCRTVDVS